jgi:hypothetical protein
VELAFGGTDGGAKNDVELGIADPKRQILDSQSHVL